MKKWLSMLLAALLVAAMVLGAQAEELALDEYEDEAMEIAGEIDVLSDEGEPMVSEAEAMYPDEEIAEASDEMTAEVAAEAAVASNAAENAASGVAIDASHFPDANFREYVSSELDMDGDGILSDDEREAVTEIYVDDCSISSLVGIEWFPNLDVLDCEDNKLASLDVSKCTKLKVLSCGWNQLKSLNISGCKGLEDLECGSNKLTSLNLSGYSKLEGLSCYGNKLTSLNVTGCSELDSLECQDNQLTSLKLDSCPKLVFLNCGVNRLTSLNLSACPKMFDLKCYSNTGELNIDITSCGYLIDAARQTPKIWNDEGITIAEFEAFVNDGGFYSGIEIGTSIALTANKKVLYGPLSYATVTVADQIYTGKALTPAVTVKLGDKTLKKDTDYTLTYANNKAVGKATVTVTGKGVYTGKKTASFNISTNSLSYATVTVKDQTYTGKALTPAVTVKLGDKTLKKGTDYTLTYANNKAVGKASVTVKGKGAYTGSKKAEFAIKPVDLSKCVITVKDQTYTGKALKPAVTVKLGSKTLKKNSDYTLAYANNKAVGKATVTVKGKGAYVGTGKSTFAINPKKVSGLKLKAGKKQITVTWKKASGVTGYQVQYGLKKDFSDAKTATVSKAAMVKKVLSGLTSKKVYYVRLRSYKAVDNVNYYSAWSAAKKVKTK